MAEQSEAGDVGDRVRRERPQHLRRSGVERCHPAGRLREIALPREHEPRAERLRQEDRVAGAGAALDPDAVGMDGADDREPVLRLGVADRVPAGEDRAGRAHLLVGAREDRRDEVRLELLREGRDRQREQRRAAHGEDVVERVRCRDPSEERRVVDERREEVDREDEGALVVQPVDRGVVRRIEADEEVLRLRWDEALQQLLEPRGGVLGSARKARCFHSRLL